MKPDNELFEKIAKDYAEEYGRVLKEENERLAASDVQLSSLEERRIRDNIKKAKGHRWSWQMGLAAACVLMVLMFPLSSRFLNPAQDSSQGPDYDASESSDEFELGDEPDLDETFETFELVAALPDGYQITNWEQDRGQTIYYLAEERNDDVVLVMEKAEDDLSTQGLKENRLKGETVYGLARSDYNILTFVKDDIQYTMTCRYDMSTLLVLGSSIL